MRNNKIIKWFFKHSLTIVSCVLITGLGIAFLAWSSPGTTTIGEGISTGDLTASGTISFPNNSITDAMVVDTITASNYLPLTGGTMTGDLTVNVNSTAGLLVEQDGVKNDILVVDTTNGYVGIGVAPSAGIPLEISASPISTATSSIGFWYLYEAPTQPVMGTLNTEALSGSPGPTWTLPNVSGTLVTSGWLDGSINTNLIPDTDNSYDLGAEVLGLPTEYYAWKNLYLKGNLSDFSNSLTIANAKTAYDVSQDNTKVGWVSAPASATSTCIAGRKAYNSDYLYICTATDTWKRVGIASW